MKLRVFLIALLLLAPLTPSISATPPKAGAVCTKAGITKNYNGKKFTCIKSGKKLVWNNGVLIKQAAPLPTPSPSPTPTPTRPQLSFIEMLRSPVINGQYPITLETFPAPTKFPTSWDDVYENREGVAYRAWLSISEAAKTFKSSLGTIRVTTGPNTTLPFTDIEPAMNLVSRAFSSAAQPSLVTLLAFTYQDQSWADGVYRQLISSESESFKRNHQQYVSEMCSSTRQVCWSAMGFTNTSGEGIILLGVVERDKLRTLDPSYSSFSRSEEGLTIAHEYFHTVQRKIIDKNWYRMEFTPPIWFNEGSAVFVENGAMNFNSFDRYMRFRLVDSKLGYPSCGISADGCITVSEAVMTNFLSLSNYSTNWNNFPYGMKYEISQRIIEILVALKGHKSLTDLYAYMSQDHTFEQGFKHIYGIPYEGAIPVLAKIVADQFANNR